MNYRHKQQDALKKFVEWYNKIAKEDTPPTAISALSQTKKEINRIISITSQAMEKDLIPGLKGFVHVEKKEANEIKKASQVVINSINMTFPYTKTNPFFSVDKQTLKKQVKDFWKLKGKPGLKYADETMEINWSGRKNLEDIHRQLDYAYNYNEDLAYLQRQDIAIDSVIDTAIMENYQRINEKDAWEKFLENKQSTSGPNTSPKYLTAIKEVIEEIINLNDEEKFELKNKKIRKEDMFKNGKLIINKAVEYALEREKFREKWGETAEKGHGFNWHEKKFSEIYGALFKP